MFRYNANNWCEKKSAVDALASTALKASLRLEAS